MYSPSHIKKETSVSEFKSLNVQTGKYDTKRKDSSLHYHIH